MLRECLWSPIFTGKDSFGFLGKSEGNSEFKSSKTSAVITLIFGTFQVIQSQKKLKKRVLLRLAPAQII